jgi:hypothetical protein
MKVGLFGKVYTHADSIDFNTKVWEGFFYDSGVFGRGP